MTASAKRSGTRVGVVILAAGKAARMGAPKLLLPWGKTTVLGHVVGQWRGLGAKQVAVVCARGDTGIAAEMRRLGARAALRILNPAPDRGMFSSVRCAARWRGWLPGLTHWAIVLGDQPLVRADTLRELLAFSAARPEMICQPAHAGHGRHPVVLPRAALRALARSESPTLKAFLQARASDVAWFAADDPGLELDIDRPEDYARALELARNEELNPRNIPVNNSGNQYEPR
ncbi:MAG TPA: nucleotidyltransferase family protein [Candidatus Acidoferrum sp.]|nr:nucleotidyltransferase family protein [Candidatus Acidoferrum sp.]